MDAPLQAHSSTEVHYYLLVTPCPACGKGPWAVSPLSAQTGQAVDVAATCRACGHVQTFRFTHSPVEPPVHGEPEPLNPTDQPSRIIDLGQWLALFHLLLAQASRNADKPTARRLGFQAAECLAEALRFYGDDQLPPPEALWVPTSQAAFRDHPERFARQRLRDQQAKLPSLHTMARRLADDRTRAAEARTRVERLRRPWWKFPWWRLLRRR